MKFYVSFQFKGPDSRIECGMPFETLFINEGSAIKKMWCGQMSHLIE